MKECRKTSFESRELAARRCTEINRENAQKSIKTRLRPYQCEHCALFHLTHLSKHEYKYNTDKKYYAQVHRNAMINREVEHWNRKFGIEE